jgi:hypothetical protein
MKPYSPTLEGFRAILRVPSLGLAEIAWRWSFLVAVGAFLIFGALQFLDTLPVTSAELALLRTRQPALVAHAISHIVRGSAPRAMAAGIVAALCVGVGWIFVASLARVAGFRAMLDHFHVASDSSQSTAWRLSSLIGLNFFRVAATLAAAVACMGALLLASPSSPVARVSPGIAALILFTAVVLIISVWSMLNWFLSLASIFATKASRETFDALADAVDLFRLHRGSVLAVNTWFGLAHFGAFLVFSILAAVAIGFAKARSAKGVLFGVLVLVLMYFAVVDFLRIGRFASYLSIAVGSEAPLVPGPNTPCGSLPLVPSARVDQDEPILSDLGGNPI